MATQNVDNDALWRYYQRGYHCLIRSGVYFRKLVRPPLSHVYFRRAVPILLEYARANHGKDDLGFEFGAKMQQCPLTPRDLLHLDYAICLGYAEAQGTDPTLLVTRPILDWPGPPGELSLVVDGDGRPPYVAPPSLADFDDQPNGGPGDEDPDPPFDA